MTNKEITLCFAYNLLTLPEDPRGFSKWKKRVSFETWAKANVAKRRASRAKYYKANRAEINVKLRKKRAENQQFREQQNDNRNQNKQHVNAQERLRWQNDLSFKISKMVRCNVRCALKRNSGGNKITSTEKLLAKTFAEFATQIQSSFKPGMTWKNHGVVWELDHVRPCASFDLTDPEQQKQCFHWSNWSPEFRAINRAKGARWNGVDYRGKK